MAKYNDTKFYWLQLKEDFFDDDAIEWLESQDNGPAYALFYLKLCLKALKTNGILIKKVGDMLIPYDANKLAKLTGTPVDTVKSAIIYLKQCGLIDFLENGEIFIGQLSKMIGSQSVSAFKKQQQRMMHKMPELLENPAKELPKIEGGQKEDKGVDICPPKIELELELEKEIEKEEEKEEKSDANASDPVPYSQIQKLFNDTCKSLPKVLKMTEPRKKAIKARWIEYDRNPDVFIRLFKEAEATPFLKGKNGRNWFATFDWLMKQEPMARVLEGIYKDKGDQHHDTDTAKGTGASTTANRPDQRAITTAELEDKLRQEGSFKGYPDFGAMFAGK